MCRVLSYLIQSLSAERAFGQKLSSPIRAQIPQKYTTMGTAGDFMIQVCPMVAYRALLLISVLVNILHGCDDIWYPELAIPCPHHRPIELCSLLQEHQRDLLRPHAPALHSLLEPLIPPFRRRPPSFALLHARSLQRHPPAQPLRKPKPRLWHHPRAQTIRRPRDIYPRPRVT